MDERRLFEVLHELSLSRREAEIYLFLSKKGPQKTNFVASTLKVDRVQAYRLLTSLQEKGLVEKTIEAPTRYIAVPVESLIETHITTRKNQIARLEAEKGELISYVKSLRTREPEYPMARFHVISGKDGIHSKILQMMNESKKEVLGLTTSLGLIQEDTAGVTDAIIESAREKKDVTFRMLTSISRENLDTIKYVVKKIPRKTANIEWRHADLGSKFYPRFVIKDDEETLLYVMPKDEASTTRQEDTGLWITSRMFVSTLRASFLEIWRVSAKATDKIRELETGTPMEETIVIKEPEDSQAKIDQVLENAQKEAVVISSSAGINRIAVNDLFHKCCARGVKLRIMAPVDLDNLEAAQNLATRHQVKHVTISYLTMMAVDNRHLFIFKAPPLEEAATKTPFYLRDTFYTNDEKYVERAAEILNDIWKRGTLISSTSAEASLGMPPVEVPASSTVLEVIDAMLENNVSSVFVTENKTVIGVIDQQHILNKVVKARKDPSEITARKIMSIPVLTVDSGEPLIEALKMMKEKHIPRLAVMKNGKLVAMLT